MAIEISRREMIKLAGAGVVATSMGKHVQAFSSLEHVEEKKETPAKKDKWHITHDRVWIGKDYWANPMEDWCIKQGGVECLSVGGNRSVHCLTHQITDPTKGVEVSVVIRRLEENKQDGGGGLRLGARSELNEVKSNCFVQQGLDIGIVGQQFVIGDKAVRINQALLNHDILLTVKAEPVAGAITLHGSAVDIDSNKTIAELTHIVSSDELLGNVAVVSNFNIASIWGNVLPEDKQGSRYRFEHFSLKGDGFTESVEHRFGPILWTMYTLNNSGTDEAHILKLSVYTGPLGEKDNPMVELQLELDGAWESVATQALDTDAWMTTFRIANWNAEKKVRFRARYVEAWTDNSQEIDVWEGVIQAEPKDRPLRMGAFTCQNDYAFPYEPVANNVMALNPDILFFSGDQIYESHGGFGVVRAPDDKAILNYLRKYYQFGWAFREVMRNTPTLCIPDDHDVLQGNLWGSAGAMMEHPEKDPSASILTGYIHSPKFVNIVHQTHTSHHPEPYNPNPKAALNDIQAYYGELLYGDVGFIILSDRQFKSGPDEVGAVVGRTGQDETPLYVNPELDAERLNILGEEQEAYLQDWSTRWRGHKLKAILSQTIFASLATHNGSPDRYLKYDFDSNGWAASPRSRAIDAMRASMGLHICGDTHLASISQYGVEEQRDSNWAFCVPAIGAGWQRFWFPEQVGLPMENRPQHNLPDTGEYLDAFGNKNYVYAVANPVVGVSKNRYVKAQEKGSGFGLVLFDTEALTYTCMAYRFLADVTDPHADNVYAGWPVVVKQEENRGVNTLS